MRNSKPMVHSKVCENNHICPPACLYVRKQAQENLATHPMLCLRLNGRLGIQPLFGDESAFSPRKSAMSPRSPPRKDPGDRGLIPEQRLDTEPS